MALDLTNTDSSLSSELSPSSEETDVQWIDPIDWVVNDWVAFEPVDSGVFETFQTFQTLGGEATDNSPEEGATTPDAELMATTSIIITDPLICFPPGFRPGSTTRGPRLDDPIPTDPWPMPEIPGSDLDVIYVDDMPTVVDNLITGTSGNDRLTAGSTSSGIYGGQGNDTIRGSQQRDLLWGDEGNDKILGRGGSDRLYGGDGRDRLRGGAGDDILRGGTGRDTLLGGTGDDTLFGNEGRDRLKGGAGADVFVLEAGTGTDKIVDFGAGDRLGLVQIAFSELTIRQQGDNTRIKLGGETLAILVGVDANTITPADFGHISYAL
ncbi:MULTISPECIES: calcium-binding protein [unclassified Leptolyngbya]|uniref:calcium-binding protein n=1 Tax=unclassified Leptolyngbya TaxID=2650499 RepID=UPI001685A370|nr:MULTISPECIES: calcium-binding protein [unclassified Leptolyngbya]MBD1910908.1 hypothetical protein [Leptolyngbya sp. FACHB-8]MBD2154953.1 hypothetical protein [Leptolyngbya sp. FACHB-16]